MNNFYKKKDEDNEYRLSARKLGAPLSIQSANQIEDMGKRLNEGISNIEVSAISPEIAGSIPVEHFKEMKRLADLTDSKVSVHAPIVDASGFHEQKWSEHSRRAAEQEFSSIVERAGILGENTPVVIHGANTFGQEWDKEVQEKYRKDIKEEEEKYRRISKRKLSGEEKEFLKEKFEELEKEKNRVMPRVMAVVNAETGQVAPLEYEEKEQFLGKEVWHPMKRLRSLNNTEWDKEKLEVMSYLKTIDELEEQKSKVSHIVDVYEQHRRDYGEKDFNKEDIQNYNSARQKMYMVDKHIEQIDQHINSKVEDIHDKFKRFKNDNKEIGKFLESDAYKNTKEKLVNINKEIHSLLMKERSHEEEKRLNELSKGKIDVVTKIIAEMPTPQVWKPVNEFAITKASETFANVAMKAYEKFKDKAPIIAIENSYPNMPLSRAEDLKKAIDKSRELFVNELVGQKKLKREEAQKVASKLIGATWDVGHINLLRKAGYSEEEIVKEASKIAKDVKHVHLTDNFGLNDTHLPPGMGNVPIKDILKELEAKNDMDGVRHIIEAGNFVQHFKKSPYPYALEGLGSPLYKFGDTPYWSSLQEQNLTPAGEYFMGYGDILPDLHFKKLYGSGFSGLPKELGGGGEASDRGRFASGE